MPSNFTKLFSLKLDICDYLFIKIYKLEAETHRAARKC